MRLVSIKIDNYRSFVSTKRIELDSINVLIGPNNAGKSSVLRAISIMQNGVIGNLPADIRRGARESKIEIEIQNPKDFYGDSAPHSSADLTINVTPGKVRHVLKWPGGENGVSFLPNVEPGHFVVPYLSKRKTVSYNEDVRQQFALAVEPQFTNLAAKLSRLGNPHFPGHDRYAAACEAILGFVVTAVPSANGQRPGVYLPDRSALYIDQMGEGVPNIVGLLVDLSLSKRKMFLVEEPENDLHPSALKALLELVVESSRENQFVVSTHSNIVARHLGAASNSRLYYVDSKRDVMPQEATIRVIEATPQARIEVLRELGYSLSDLDLWDGWLILEESSAERLIRDYLIPWFTPKLTRVRTVATGGNSQVEPTFDDFHRLVRFTHLEPIYQSATWVLVDGDEDGRKIVESLRNRYLAWSTDRFDWFHAPHFEQYYPAEFSKEVQAALALPDKAKRREAKHVLLERVRGWLDQDETRGRTALAESAIEVITKLREIENKLIK